METETHDDFDILRLLYEEEEKRNGVETPSEPQPAVATYRVHMLMRDNADDWRLHPYVMGRVISFFAEHEPQGNPAELVRNVQQSFAMTDPGLMVLAIMRNGELIGHVLCERAILYFEPIVTVHQYALDHGIPVATRREIVETIRAWARDQGPDGEREPAKFLQWLVRDKRLVPMYQRMFKAKPELLLMRLPVEEAEDGE